VNFRPKLRLCRTAAKWNSPSPCLLEGVDELGYILKSGTAIGSYEAQRVDSINTLA